MKYLQIVDKKQPDIFGSKTIHSVASSDALELKLCSSNASFTFTDTDPLDPPKSKIVGFLDSWMIILSTELNKKEYIVLLPSNINGIHYDFIKEYRETRLAKHNVDISFIEMDDLSISDNMICIAIDKMDDYSAKEMYYINLDDKILFWEGHTDLNNYGLFNIKLMGPSR